MSQLNEFERSALDHLLAGDHPILAVLRTQSEGLQVKTRTYTGVGFHSELEVRNDAPTVVGDFELGDVEAELEGLRHGAGLVLFVRGGRLKTLEGYTYDEPWPSPMGTFSFKYSDPESKLELATLREGDV